jgi:hypothetical protein
VEIMGSKNGISFVLPYGFVVHCIPMGFLLLLNNKVAANFFFLRWK